MHQSRLMTSTDHVAAFAVEHLQVRSAGRKKAIERALREASNRHAALAVLKTPPEPQTEPSGVGVPWRSNSAPVFRQPSTLSGVGPPSARGPGISFAPPVLHLSPSPQDASSSGTLGALRLSHAPKSKSAVPVIAAAAALVATLGMVGGGAGLFFFVRARHQSSAVEGEPQALITVAQEPLHDDPPVSTPPPPAPPPPPSPIVAQAPGTGIPAATNDPPPPVAAASRAVVPAPVVVPPVAAAIVPVASKPQTAPTPSASASARKPAAPKKVDDFGF